MKTRISAVLQVGLLVPATTALLFAETAPKTALHEGTPVRMRISRTITSADARVGENVDFETLDDVMAGETVVIPKGSVALATVTEAASKRRMGRGGKLSVNIDYVRLPSGEKLALRGVQDAKGGGHVGAMTGAIVATSIVFFPAAPLFLFMHGKDITIPKGHEVTVYTNTEYELKSARTLPVKGTDMSAATAVQPHETPVRTQAGLRIVSNPPGATVMVDGKYVGVTPTGDLRLPEGLHEVVVKRVGCVDSKFEVNGTEGVIRVELKADTDPTKPKIVGL